MTDRRIAIKKKIIRHLYFGQPMTFLEISECIERSLPLTMQIVNEMVSQYIVKENGLAGSTGGRRAQVFSINKNFLYVVAVAMDQLLTRIALVDHENKIVGEIKHIPIELKDNNKALDQLIGGLRDFLKNCGVKKQHIAGIGIGMPGFIDINKGINLFFIQLPKGKSIIGEIEKAFDIPVLIDNDSGLIALAEHKWGAARDRDNTMVINIGWGVGLGMIIGGKLFRGHNGFAGEFSHISIFNNNMLCSCGKYGCLETETSLLYIASRALNEIKAGNPSSVHIAPNDSLKEIASKVLIHAAEGDKLSMELIKESGYNIGRGLAILIHLVDPDLIVISGRGAEAGKAWLPPIQQAINEHAIPKLSEGTDLKLSQLGENAEIIGAAALVMEHYEELKHKPENESPNPKKSKTKIPTT